MVKMKELIKAIINKFQIISVNDYPAEREILRVDLLDEHTLLDERTLYLCMDPDSLEWSSFHHYPKAVLQKQLLLTSSQTNYPFISVHVNQMPDILTLFQFINQFLADASTLATQIARLYNCLYQGQGLRAVINMAQDFFQAPVSICDVSYHFIASSTDPVSDPNKSGTSRAYLETEEIESMKYFQVVNRIYNEPNAFFISTPDHPDSSWIFCAVRIHHVIAGYIAIRFSSSTVATPHELQLATALSDVCSIELQRQDSFLTKTGLSYENFLIDLIEGKFTDSNVIRSRIEVLDRKFCKYYCIVSMVCTRPHNSEIFTHRQMDNLRKLYPNSMSVVYQDKIILFINQDNPIVYSENLTSPLAEFAALNKMKVGMSQPFSDIVQIPDFYKQAVDSIKYGERLHPDHFIYYSQEYCAQYLFDKCSYRELENYIHHHIRYLSNYDETYHTELIATIRSFLLCNRNATKTAEYLHIHRSTLFYRIKKIEELLDASMNDSHLLFSYELSFAIWDYLYQ